MNPETAIQLARQRMLKIGKTRREYHLEAVTVAGSAIERDAKLITVKAYNQYYYLVNYEKYFGLQIISDTGYFNSDNPTNNTIQEFTGLIEIRELAGATWSIQDSKVKFPKITPLDFIQVTIY